MLTSGALRVDPWRFLTALAGMRLVRFAIEGALAAYYGGRILSWMESTVFEVIVGILIGAAILGTIVSGVAIYRSLQREKRERQIA